MEFLTTLNVPFIKIGSGDANNFPLLQRAAKLDKPLVISTVKLLKGNFLNPTLTMI